MSTTAPPTTSEPNRPDPSGDRSGSTVPECIALILHLVRVLLNYGKNLDQTFEHRLAHKQFATLAAGFGTFDSKRILAHIERGILRAMMLEKYLLARAAKGRDIEPKPPANAADQDEIAAFNVKVGAQRMRQLPTPRKRPDLDPDDPLRFYIPTAAEIYAQVRHRSIGRTLADIAMDLGIRDKFCDGLYWYKLYLAIKHYGGDLDLVCDVEKRRLETFEKERDRRPHTGPGHWYWQDRARETFRELLGCWIGEPPPDPPGVACPLQATAPP